MTSEAGLDMEARGVIYLGFYQKELALHSAACLDCAAAELCIDRQIDPVFKACPSPARLQDASCGTRPMFRRLLTTTAGTVVVSGSLACACDLPWGVFVHRHQGPVKVWGLNNTAALLLGPCLGGGDGGRPDAPLRVGMQQLWSR